MISPRELHSIANGLGMTRVNPTNAQRREAIASLERIEAADDIVDPGVFAKEVHYTLSNDEEVNGWTWAVIAKEQADFAQAREALFVAEPHLRTVPFAHLITRFDDAAMNVFYAVYEAGLRHGAAFEHLRRAVVGEVVQCQACVGLGFSRTGDACQRCGGTATVALPGPQLTDRNSEAKGL